VSDVDFSPDSITTRVDGIHWEISTGLLWNGEMVAKFALAQSSNVGPFLGISSGVERRPPRLLSFLFVMAFSLLT